MKIAIVVPGRFHAFDLAGALLDRDCDVSILTNYPRWAVGRFGFPTERVHSFWPHGVLTRMTRKLESRSLRANLESRLHPWFGRWARERLRKEHWDVVHVWSGVAEECLEQASTSMLYFVMRGSAHIRTQAR